MKNYWCLYLVFSWQAELVSVHSEEENLFMSQLAGREETERVWLDGQRLTETDGAGGRSYTNFCPGNTTLAIIALIQSRVQQ